MSVLDIPALYLERRMIDISVNISGRGYMSTFVII
jgi:hypothetical protein